MAVIASLSYCAECTSQDSKTRESNPKGVFTLLGTIKGEVDKVSEGGRKLEVKYKELVTSTTSSSSSSKTKGGVAGKFRPSIPKEFIQKEKNQEIEVRVLDNAVIRILNNSEATPPSKSSDKKKSGKTTGKKDDNTESDDDQNKTKDKTPAKPGRKSTEPSLPGKAGDPGSLKKGQIILITIYREDLPGFSRLVTNTIYILGEK